MSDDKNAVTSILASKLDSMFSTSSYSYDYQKITDVVRENSLINESLHRSIEMVNAVLSTQLESSHGSKVFIPIVSALIGALSAFLFNRFHWTMVERKKKESESLTMLSTLITELETLAVDYWTKDYNKEDQKNEVYIKSRIRLLTKYIRLINKDKKENKDIKNDLEAFESDIFDLTTGDDFESKNRKASKQKAMSISFRCSDIRALISYFC